TDQVAAEAYACDAQIAPMVNGYVDPAVLDAMIRELLSQSGLGTMTGHGPGFDAPGHGDDHAAASGTPTREHDAVSDAAGRDPLAPAALAAATRELTTSVPLSGEAFALPRWA